MAPQYLKAIIPCKGLCTAIEPGPGAPYRRLPETYAIRHGPGAFIYQISRNDGSIIVGGASYVFKDDLGEWYGNSDDGVLIGKADTYFDGYMQRTFFGWEDSRAEVKHIWTGGMFLSFFLSLFRSCSRFCTAVPLVCAGEVRLEANECEINSDGI